MSRYNTMILSFGWGEIDEPEDDGDDLPRDCEPLRQVNAWLKERGYDELEDMAGGWLGMNVCLFGGCYNHILADEFCELVQSLGWRAIENVRVLFWDEEDETFTLIPSPLKKRGRRRRKPA